MHFRQFSSYLNQQLKEDGDLSNSKKMWFSPYSILKTLSQRGRHRQANNNSNRNNNNRRLYINATQKNLPTLPTPPKYSNYILFFKLFDIQKYLYLRKNKNKDIWPILNYYFLFLFPFPFSFLTFSLLFSFSPIHHSLFFTALEFLKKFLLYISAEGTRI